MCRILHFQNLKENMMKIYKAHTLFIKHTIMIYIIGLRLDYIKSRVYSNFMLRFFNQSVFWSNCMRTFSLRKQQRAKLAKRVKGGGGKDQTKKALNFLNIFLIILQQNTFSFIIT